MNLQNRLCLDWTKVQDVCPVEAPLAQALPQLASLKNALRDGTLSYKSALGWLQPGDAESVMQMQNMIQLTSQLHYHCNAAVVVGIGGSYLGARAVHEALAHGYPLGSKSQGMTLFWAGNGLATDELAELLDALDGYSPCLVAISKTGTTTEPALALRLLLKYMENRYGKGETFKRTLFVTDPFQGSFLSLAKTYNCNTFVFPKDVGGRYSVFTPSGTLPLLLAGHDARSFCEGGKQAAQDLLDPKNNSLDTNPALCYAGIRNALYSNGKYKIESLCVWSGKLRYLSLWWQQLFGESDGKEKTGLFPSTQVFSADLHSMGQYFQEGERLLTATHLKISDEFSSSKGSIHRKLHLPLVDWEDGMSFVNGKSLDHVQEQAQLATMLAHADGGVPTAYWEIPQLTPFWLGYWMYTNLMACAVGALARGVNPFDQPGVEAYKQNMFALLQKPGYESQAQPLRQRLERGSRLRSIGFCSQENGR